MARSAKSIPTLFLIEILAFNEMCGRARRQHALGSLELLAGELLLVQLGVSLGQREVRASVQLDLQRPAQRPDSAKNRPELKRATPCQ